jgi:urea transport system ATP-binding protein
VLISTQTGRVLRMLADRGELADQYLVLVRGEVVMQGRGDTTEADSVRRRMAI